MFGSRRHRPPNPPLTAATVNPNAATAAAAVFKRHESNPSLSAAAAAAALRARPTTPIRVADVQTKRTLRRSASVASTGTTPEQTQDQSMLRRRGSSGSMTERTFRTPSPHRPGSSGSGHQRSQSFSENMPPVPAIPRNMDTTSRQSGGIVQFESQNRRANGPTMGVAPVRLASQKLASGETPSWFGAAKIGDLGSVRRTDPAMASPPSSPLQALAREEGPSEGARPSSQASSINFSYPTRARRGSANVSPTADLYTATQAPSSTNHAHPLDEGYHPPQPPRVKQPPRGQAAVQITKRQPAPNSSDQALVYDPNSRRMVRQADLLAVQHVQQAVINASQQPTGSKRKKKRTPQRAGSHLAAGTVSRVSHTTNGASSTAPSAKVQPPSTAAQAQPQRLVEPKHPIEAAPVQETQEDVEEPAVKAIISSPRIEAKRLEQQRAQNAAVLPRISIPAVPNPTPAALDAPQYAVRRQPSMVREEPEPEDAEDEKKSQSVVYNALDAVPGRLRIQPAAAVLETHSSSSLPQNIALPPNSVSHPPTNRVHQTPKANSVDVSEDGKPKPGTTDYGRVAHVSRERTHSSSPARQAHFGPVQDNLTVKYSPPPRSTSPRKSAMKHASPTGGASPSGDTSEASGSINQEPPVARKKSVRVSFDDGNNAMADNSAAVNRGDSPLAISPLQADRHSWLTGLGRRQDLSSFDDDVVMKPRPALPSFGSVRARKPRDTSPDQSERPLVRPKGETKYTSPLLPSPPLGPSSDHVLGAVLSKESGTLKERAEHSEESSGHREPLPPVVTSVEGTGYFSDSSDTTSIRSSEFGQPEASFSTTVTEPRPEQTTASQTMLYKAPVNDSALYPDREVVLPEVTEQDKSSSEPPVPTISVSQPTPPGPKNNPLGQSFMDVPGGFPEDESDQSTASTTIKSAQAAAAAKPAEVMSQDGQLVQPAVQTILPTAVETTTDSDSDIYSDAYEDLSEIEGDGFQSLDAVVESPIQRNPRPTHRAEHTSEEAPPQDFAEEVPKLQTELSSATTAVEPQLVESPQDDWEKAKAYWRSLTAEKRAQLEREAIEEAGVDADKDDVQSDTKPKKKKTVERRNSERKALAIHMAQQMAAQQGKERAVNTDRSYMIKPGERWTGEDELDIPPMRKTMRDEPQQQTTVISTQGSRLRKSLRSSGSGRNTHGAARADSQTASNQPGLAHPAAVAPTETRHRRPATQAQVVSSNTTSIQPPLGRRGSTGSESSFKRSRSARGQGFGFRHSMRPISPPSVQSDNHAFKRFSLRSLSPASTGSPPATQMRTTLRSSSTGRKTPTGIRMPSFSLSYGGGKKSDLKGPKNRTSSRFADSSDEEGGGGVSSGFRSRFEDSSDDEPIVPIPALPNPTSSPSAATGAGTGHHLRKESSVASTALPEELEEESETSEDPTTEIKPTSPPPAAVDNPTNLRRTRSGRGQLQLSSSPLSQAADNTNDKHEGARTSRRNSFMSVLRYRKRDSGAAAAKKINRPEITESAARRDTRLERSVGQLERIRSLGEKEAEADELPSPMSSSTKSPRLQKRGSKKGIPSTTAAALEMGMASEARNGGLVMVGGGTGGQEKEEGTGEADVFAAPPPLGRSSTAASGNLGTRTLSGGGSRGFRHLHAHFHPQRRVSSMGMDGGGGGGVPVTPSVDGGSMAGASSTTRKKRFGTLRKIFGLNE